MGSRNKKYTFALVSTLCICVLALYIHRHRQGQTGHIDNLLISTTSNFQKSFFYLGHGFHSIWEHYFMLVNVQKKNEELTREVEKLKAELTQMAEIASENDRLRESLDFKDEELPTMIAAHVIAHDVSNDYFGIRIDRGKKDGVTLGMGVVSTAGVVGRVTRASESYADVVTLSDPMSNIDVIIQRSRARGILSGQTKTLLCKMKYMDRLEDVALHDTVVASGFGGIFPKGLLVGYVTDVQYSSSSILQNVVVKTAIDIHRLEEVFLVVPSTKPEKVASKP